jgi:hypothetical protein
MKFLPKKRRLITKNALLYQFYAPKCGHLDHTTLSSLSAIIKKCPEDELARFRFQSDNDDDDDDEG